MTSLANTPGQRSGSTYGQARSRVMNLDGPIHFLQNGDARGAYLGTVPRKGYTGFSLASVVVALTACWQGPVGDGDRAARSGIGTVQATTAHADVGVDAPGVAPVARALAGRVVDAKGEALAGWSIRIDEADAVVLDAEGGFSLTRSPSWANAPAMTLSVVSPDEQARYFAFLPADAWPAGKPLVFATPDSPRETLRVVGPHPPAMAATIRAQDWANGWFWRWQETQELGDEQARTREEMFSRMQREIDAESEAEVRAQMRRLGFLVVHGDAAPYMVEPARRVLEDFGPEHPAWGLRPRALLSALHASGALGDDLAGVHRRLVVHPQPELAAYATLELYLMSSHEGAFDAAAAIWTAYAARPELARTFHGGTLASLGPERPLAPGRVVGPICGVDLNGQASCVEAPSQAGLVLIDFWATTCGGCRESMPTVREIASRRRREGMSLATYSFNTEEDRETIRGFSRTTPIAGASLSLESEGDRLALTRRLGITSIPRFVLLDARGRVLTSGPELNVENLDAELGRWAAWAKADGDGEAVTPGRG